MSGKSSQAEKGGPLEKYHAKRDFKKTPEPGAELARKSGNSFVIQEHHARSHHFDFRLEMDGVLVSWDKGEWQPLETSWRKDFAAGTLKFHLAGKRLNGPYLLARMKDEPNWMLKMLNPATHPLPVSKPNREEANFISPQLARVAPSVPTGSQWLHEIKFDGYRLIAVQRKQVLTLYTRNQIDWTDRFKELARHLMDLTVKDFVLDGEAVVFDEKGRSRFGDLQKALQTGKTKKITFVAFDLLHFDGLNLRDMPLARRLEQLAGLLTDEAGIIRRSHVWAADMGADLFKQACKNGLEGIISKSSMGRYLEGARKDWAKSKCRARQEFIICGYTPPKGSLPAFGALVLGSFENGKLIPRGKVGTGFRDDARRRLLESFKPLRTSKPAFPSKEPAVTWLEPKLVAEIEFAEITREWIHPPGKLCGPARRQTRCRSPFGRVRVTSLQRRWQGAERRGYHDQPPGASRLSSRSDHQIGSRPLL